MSDGLQKLFAENLGVSTTRVNDEGTNFGDTPKERIINALYLIDSGIMKEFFKS